MAASVAALLCALTTACSDSPRTRLGALPFPGPFTLFALADPNDLGIARYKSLPSRIEHDEESHGILYTQRAGFLDLAHIRETMDWSWFISTRVNAALSDSQPALRLSGYDNCPINLSFNYPDDWTTLADEDRRLIVSELAIRIGQLVAFDLMTWHEIITWHGYRTTLIIPEKGSAFTYDDTMSHLVGLLAADDALRRPDGSWDLNATDALNIVLARLAVVPREQATIAVDLVKGHWWQSGLCVRRNLDLGIASGSITPWLVRGAPWPDVTPEPFPLPTLSDIAGRDYTHFWNMTIEPSALIPAPVKNISSLPGHLIDPQVHFPLLMDQLRREMKEELGPNVDRPYDDGQ